jgi:hypothetical protein
LKNPAVHGLIAEFVSAGQLVDAVRRARRVELCASIEAYSPCPVEGLNAALDLDRGRIPMWMLLGGLTGGLGTYALEWYSAVHAYPINIGGRPLDSWPAFLPAAIEMTLLCAAVCGVGAMLRANGLPRLFHPLFGVHVFERASSDRFFIVLRSDGPQFDPVRARDFLQTLSPASINEVAQ